jgi:hypothetical protein
LVQPSPAPPPLHARIPTAARGLALAAFVVIASFWALAVPFPTAYEYAEGDTATWIWIARHGEPLYRATSGLPMRRTNYPPLGLALAARAAPDDEHILATGRLLSLAGFALALAMVGLSVRAATGSAAAGLVAALLLGGTLRAGFWAGVCRPDALGFGCAAAGVTAAALRVRGWWLIAACMFAMALLTKQNLIVMPVGTAAWALLRERRRGLLLVAATGALLGAVLWRAPPLVDALVRSSLAAWRPANFLRHLATSVAPSGLAIAMALALVRERARLPERARRVVGPWAGVLLAGLAWTVALGRVGADFNYLLELIAASTVLASIAAAHGKHARMFSMHAGICLVETAAWVAALALTVLPAKRAEAAAAARALRGVDGPVFAEQSWYATASGHPPVVIPFLATQLAAGGRWDPAPLVEAVQRGELRRVLAGFSLEDDPAASRLRWHEERYPPGVVAALRERYRLVDRAAPPGELWIYAPR